MADPAAAAPAAAPAAARADRISLTVKVPFSADLSVTTNPSNTVNRLLELVQSICPPHLANDAPQCIVHAGRPLAGDATLTEAGITHGAVLHLMRRPTQRHSTRRSSSSGRRAAAAQAQQRRQLAEFHQEIHQQVVQHHHHHRGNNGEERHIHANVLIGHIAVDGRIHYDDAYDVLSSVLHAVGFAPPAVAAASAAAAALAIANHAPTERGHPLTYVRDLAWNATRSASLSNATAPPSRALESPTDAAAAADTAPQPQQQTQPRQPPNPRPAVPRLPAEPPQPDPAAVVAAAAHPYPDDYAASVAAARDAFPATAALLRSAADWLDAFDPATYFARLRDAPGAAPNGRDARRAARERRASATQAADVATESAARTADDASPADSRAGAAADAPGGNAAPSTGPGSADADAAARDADTTSERASADEPSTTPASEADAAANATTNDTPVPQSAAAAGPGARDRASSPAPDVDGYQLLGQLASVANALTASNALLASLLPDAAMVGAAATPNSNEAEEPASDRVNERNGENNASNPSPRPTRRIVTDTRTTFSSLAGNASNTGNTPAATDANGTGESGSQQRQARDSVQSGVQMPGQTERPGDSHDATRSTEPSEAPPDDDRRGVNPNVDEEENNSFDEEGVFDEEDDGDYEMESEDSADFTDGDDDDDDDDDDEDDEEVEDDEMDIEPLNSEEMAQNADFAVRLISCYLGSAMDKSPLPEGALPGEAEGWTAARLLDEVYAPRGQTPALPPCRVLRIVHRIMDLVTPREFDAICRGDMRALGPHRRQVWRILLESGLHDGDSLDEDDLDDEHVIEDMLDDVYESIHEFIHMVERDARRQSHPTMGEGTFCDVVMHAIQHLAGEFVSIFSDEFPLHTEERRRQLFAEKLSAWLSNAAATVQASLISELGISPVQLRNAFRSSLASIGQYYLGGNAAVLVPLTANLFSEKAEKALEALIDRDEHTWPQNGDNGQPNAANSGESRGSADTSRNHAPETAAGPTNPSPSPSIPATQASAVTSSATSLHPASDRETTAAMDDVQLDDDELDALAREFNTECASDTPAPASELNDLAKEFEAEQHTSPASGSGASSSAATPKPILPTASRTTAARPTGLPSSLASSVAGPFRQNNLGIGAASAGLGGGGARLGRASFGAAAAVPRGSGSHRLGGSSAARGGDEFDRAFSSSPSEAARWRSVVEADEMRLSTMPSRGPLSRAYMGSPAPVPPLDAASASTMAADNARAAAEAARLPESVSANLQRVAAENGELYLREYEKAIATRLSTDADFDAERFPNAAERFLQSKK